MGIPLHLSVAPCTLAISLRSNALRSICRCSSLTLQCSVLSGRNCKKWVQLNCRISDATILTPESLGELHHTAQVLGLEATAEFADQAFAQAIHQLGAVAGALAAQHFAGQTPTEVPVKQCQLGVDRGSKLACRSLGGSSYRRHAALGSATRVFAHIDGGCVVGHGFENSFYADLGCVTQSVSSKAASVGWSWPLKILPRRLKPPPSRLKMSSVSSGATQSTSMDRLRPSQSPPTPTLTSKP